MYFDNLVQEEGVMNTRRLSLLVIIGFVFLTVFSAVKAQGTPHYPSPVKPGNGVTITDSNSIEFCVTPNDPGESRIEVFQGPIDDFQSPWNSNNPACWTYTLPNGHYTWHTRGKNSAGEGGAGPDLTFTVQVGNQQPPTRVPGPENATAVPDVGPDFSYSFNPANETNVGQGVTIHITVNCGPNCGEVDTTPSCGGGDQPVNTSGNFDYHWNTNGCNPGGASISICSKARSDPQGTRRNCKSPGYQLNGQTSPDSPVIESFTADNIATTGECTTLRWTTRNATSVVLNGQGVATTGSMQVCPKSSQQFGLRASNGRGPDATGNVVIQVNNSSVPGVSSSSNGGGPQVGPALNNQRPEDARQSGVPGGVNLINYAYAKGFSNADNSNGSANGWYLSGGPRGESWQLNGASEWAKVCFDVYGSGYAASNPQNTRDGWRCVTGNGSNSNSGNTNQEPQPQQDTGCTNTVSPRLSAGGVSRVNYANGGAPNILRSGPGKQYGKIAMIPAGTQMQITGGAVCASNYWYWPVQGSNFSGWMAEGDNSTYWMEPLSGANPAVPATPVVQSQSQPTAKVAGVKVTAKSGEGQVTYSLQCGDLGFALPVTPQPGEVLAVEQCVQYVIRAGLDNGLIRCMQRNGWKTTLNTGAADTIDALRQYSSGCGVVAVYRGSQLDLGSLAKYGAFLVVWQSYCGTTGEAGHIAKFISYSNGTIRVDDANMPANADGGIHDHNISDKDKNCMVFIQLSGMPVPVGKQSSSQSDEGFTNGNTGNAKATNIAWSFCVACISQAWVEFDLPTNIVGYRLTFRGNDVPVEDMSVRQDGSVWKVTFHISAVVIQHQIDAGYKDKLGDPANWNLFYLVAK